MLVSVIQNDGVSSSKFTNRNPCVLEPKPCAIAKITHRKKIKMCKTPNLDVSRQEEARRRHQARMINLLHISYLMLLQHQLCSSAPGSKSSFMLILAPRTMRHRIEDQDVPRLGRGLSSCGSGRTTRREDGLVGTDIRSSLWREESG